MTLLFLLPLGAWAACSSPAGAETDLVYNGDFHTYQYCDGTTWQAVGGGVSSWYYLNAIPTQVQAVSNGTPITLTGLNVGLISNTSLISSTAGGLISATYGDFNTVSATRFIGDGSGLTGISAGVTPTWYSISQTTIPTQVVAVSNSGNISLTNLDVSININAGGISTSTVTATRIWASNAGTSSAPTYTFQGFSTTGMYNTNNTLRLDTGGTIAAQFSATGTAIKSAGVSPNATLDVYGSISGTSLLITGPVTATSLFAATERLGTGTLADAPLTIDTTSDAVGQIGLHLRGQGSTSGTAIQFTNAGVSDWSVGVDSITNALLIQTNRFTGSSGTLIGYFNSSGLTIGNVAAAGTVSAATLNATTTSGTFGYFKNVSASSIAVGNVSATGNVQAVKFIGDCSLCTGISGTAPTSISWSIIASSTIPLGIQNVSNSNGSVTATIFSGNVSGTNISATVADITTERSALMIATNISVTTNLTAGGLISASSFSGNGAGITGVNAATAAAVSYSNVSGVPAVLQNISNSTGSVTVTSINATAATLSSIGAGNLTASGIVSANILDSFILSTTAINGSNATLTGGLTTGAIAVSGVVSAGTISASNYLGNGAGLTGINAATAQAVSWSNIQNIPVGVANISNSIGSITVTSVVASRVSTTNISASVIDLPANNNIIRFADGGHIDSVAGFSKFQGFGTTQLGVDGGAVAIGNNSVVTLNGSGSSLVNPGTTNLTGLTSAGTISAAAVNVTGTTGTVSATNGYFKNVSGSTATFNTLTVSSCTGCGAGVGGSPGGATNSMQYNAGLGVFGGASNVFTDGAGLVSASTISATVGNFMNVSLTNVALNSTTLLAGQSLYARASGGGLIVDGSAGYQYDFNTDNSIFSSTDLPASTTPSATVHVSGTLLVSSTATIHALVEGTVSTTATTSTTFLNVTQGDMFRVTASSNTTISLTSGVAGKSIQIFVVQDGTGGRTIAYTSPTHHYNNATAPTVITSASTVSQWSWTTPDGVNWYGGLAGSGM